jgi:hypothetical protein
LLSLRPSMNSSFLSRYSDTFYPVTRGKMASSSASAVLVRTLYLSDAKPMFKKLLCIKVLKCVAKMVAAGR